jgi:DNA-binding PadR family transcriptional regulator
MSSKIVYFKTETLNATPLQFLVLIQLLKGPKYGYEILKNIREDFSGSWRPQTGTIYPALKGMIRRGQIEKIKEDDKELYRLSDQSEIYLKEVETYVIEFIFMTNQFIESIIKRIPSNYAIGLFDNLLKTGSLEIVPENTFVKELDRLTSKNQTKKVLELRKKILLNKLSIIEKKLTEIN